MRAPVGAIVKSLIFVAVTVVATGLLVSAISGNTVSGTTTGYRAIFTDVTSLNVGDDVRMAGVQVGSVTGISVSRRRDAEVDFTVRSGVRLAPTVTAAIRYKNLVGQRYLELDQGAGSLASAWPSSRTIGLDRTTPALDLTRLFNGFQPLFAALNPRDVNALAYEIIQVFQGQGATVDDLLTQTATLASSVADRDQLVGDVITNLTSVLRTVNAHRRGLSTTVVSLQQLVSGLARDRGAVADLVTNLNSLTGSVTGLLRTARPGLKNAIDSLGVLSSRLADNGGVVTRFLRNLPRKLDAIGRTLSYGSWVNTYLCSIDGAIPVPSGYSGGVGAHPAASRCGS